MKNTNDLDARNIVRKGLDNWVGTHKDFIKFTLAMQAAAKGVNSTEKREAFIENYIKKFKPSIFSRKIKFGLSNNFIILGEHDLSGHTATTISKANKQRALQNTQKLAQYLYKLRKRTTYVFVVKDDSKHPINELVVLIYETRGNNKQELFSSHAVGVIKKHCIERLIQRLNIGNIHAAIDEILSAVMWLEGSGLELAVRPPGSYGIDGIKRHIPTPNGALLLQTEAIEKSGDMPIQQCSLITWIHRRQFKKDQRVTDQEFKYALSVNYFLSDSDLPEMLSRIRKEIDAIRFGDPAAKINIYLHGEPYPAEAFLHSLEQGQFLDFLIDFERGLH